MHQHGETSASSTILSGQERGSVLEMFNLQGEVVDKCLNIIQQSRADKILKPKASIWLQQAIPHESAEEDSFVSAYGSYLTISVGAAQLATSWLR